MSGNLKIFISSVVLAFTLIGNNINGYTQTINEQISLFTIPNMSASFVRTTSREASQDLDAVYANPAAIAKLEDGLHFQLNNQFQFIRKDHTVSYKELSNGSSDYELNVNNFAFPTLFAAYKRGDFAYSIALYPAMGGGGASSFENLPSAELGIADMNTALSTVAKIFEERYDLSKEYSDISYEYGFESSGFAFTPGFQMGTSYQLNDRVSFFGGVRYVRYISNAKGGANNIRVTDNKNGNSIDPREFLNEMYTNEQEIIDEKPLVDLFDIEIAGKELIDLINVVIDELYTTGDTDVKQNGKGFTPILGIQYERNDQLYIGFKYEHKTKMKLKTLVANGKDADGRYVNGSNIRSDLPGLMSLGIQYKVNDKLALYGGNRIVFYKSANLNGREAFVDRNYFEISSAAEYNISKRLLLSGGYAYANLKVNEHYQNEVDYVMPTHTVAFGSKFKISNQLSIEAGLLNTFYVNQSYTKDYEAFQGKLNLPSAFDQQIKNETGGHVMLVSIGATLAIPQ